MGIKCPKCHHENPDDTIYCGKCAAPLKLSEDIEVTETIETPKEELSTGSIFAGRYQIIEELGKGGMGRVYKVLDQEVNAKIALKLIKPEISADKKSIERFRNELKTARDISHKNICRMYDLNKEAGSYYITMEFVPGEDLKSMIRMSGRLAVGTTIGIAKQICDGLAEAHKLGVVHRDLKPSNIMIDKEGSVLIMDFGIARSLKAKGITGAGVMIGTPEYMSPEQVEGKETDQRSDIYSLGVIPYEMVTGQVPFEGDTPFTIGVKYKSEMPIDPKEFNAQIPEDLSRMILRCLEKDKEKRYQSARELLTDLGSIEKGLPTTNRVVAKRKPLTSKEITVTFGMKKLLIPALVVITLAVAAVIIWRLAPQKEIALTPKIENSIAIISFENLTGDENNDIYQKSIPNLLITNLENAGYFYVVTWERLHDLLKQMGQEDVEFIDSNLGFELCRREGVEALITGSLNKAGNVFATDVKVVDVDTKRLLKSASVRGEGIDSILRTQIDELSREISLGLGITREKVEQVQFNVEDVTTTSGEAYKYYLKGVEASYKYYHEEAAGFFEQAVEIDPTFALAYWRLGSRYSLLDKDELAKQAYEKAKTFSARATEKERLYIEAAYARVIERDLEKSFRIFHQMVEKYPREKYAHYRLGLYYRQYAGDYKRAREGFEKALEIDPNYGDALNFLGYNYLDVENYDKAIECFKKYVFLNPGDPNPVDSLGEAYFRKGKIEEAIANYKEALKIKPDFVMSLHNIQYVLAFKEDYSEAIKYLEKLLAIAASQSNRWWGYLWEGFYYCWLGSVEKSLDCLQSAEDLCDALGHKLGKAVVNYLKAWVYYERGDVELSRQYNEAFLDNLLKASPQRKLYYEALCNLTFGFIDLKERHVESAKARLAQVKSGFPEIVSPLKEWTTFFYNTLLAEVSLAEDDPEKAIAVLEKESPSALPWLNPYQTEMLIVYNTPFLVDGLARAYLKKGDLDKAISAYERLMTFDARTKNIRLIHPKYHYRLAKLYEQKGDTAKAIKHYEKFLDLWKNADQDPPEIADAKSRLSSLTS